MQGLHDDLSLHGENEHERANGPLSLALSPSEGEREVARRRVARFRGRIVHRRSELEVEEGVEGLGEHDQQRKGEQRHQQYQPRPGLWFQRPVMSLNALER
jgi:hypothetical protein